MVVMAAMGMENEQEVIEMLGGGKRYYDLLLPSIEVKIFQAMCVSLLSNNFQKARWKMGF